MAVLAITQVIGWGTTFHLPAVIGQAIASDLSLSLSVVFGGISIMMLVSAVLSPGLGRAIDRHGARPVLCLGPVIMACGLLLLALAQGIGTYVLAWAVLGVAVPMTLNLGAHAAIAQVGSADVMRAMTILGFFTGLTSTLSWPLTAALTSGMGWRWTCVVYAGCHLAIVGPLHWHLPRVHSPGQRRPAAAEGGRHGPGPSWGAFATVATAIGLNCMLMTGLQVHIIGLLERLGWTTATAISLAALLGPCQAGSRALGFGLGLRATAVRMGCWAAALFCAALVLLEAGAAIRSLALIGTSMVVMGVAMGLSFPVRAALPYELFGRERYGLWAGRLGLVQNLANAAAPLLLAAAINRLGAPPALWLALAVAIGALLASMAVARQVGGGGPSG